MSGCKYNISSIYFKSLFLILVQYFHLYGKATMSHNISITVVSSNMQFDAIPSNFEY